ncbi:hypothetical protein EOD42_24405 [Rhodovarius crocodyli]|uniref:Uncharacterized protein n=1 Tax=Rhodovarius crocodyli TaxID=1979269 RepID=A0A437LXB6_9PROT|nr:hypothetical protein [Rhodovarius crocodyli]RVT90032.1 hypothetical protein EOD42_24405 [Rhodovarius crocodyli]
MTPPTALTDPAEELRETRARLARLLAEQQKLHLAMLAEARGWKRYSLNGQARQEIDLSADLLEQYLSAGDAFLENMRGRMEARLGLLRRGEPLVNGKPDDAPGHGAFWLCFSRLCAVLRRLERR